MSVTLVCLAVSWAGAVGSSPAAAVEMKPAAIALDAPPREEVQRSCVIRYRPGGMNILSVAASDPAIRVDLREDVPGEIYVVTATIPPGYGPTAEPSPGRNPDPARSVGKEEETKRTPSPRPSPSEGEGVGRSPSPRVRSPLKGEGVEILVKTDSPGSPLIHVPVHVWSGRAKPPDWLVQAKKLIGQPAPKVTVYPQRGGELEIGAVEGKVTAIVFLAYWCGHCDEHVPEIERVWKDFAGRDVQFRGVAAPGGNGKGIADAAERWGVDFPWGVDNILQAIHEYGPKAYPVVFLVGRDGIVESVHGRWSNDPKGNGLDNLEIMLRTELDMLLDGKTRAEFPDWEKTFAVPPPQKGTRCN